MAEIKEITLTLTMIELKALREALGNMCPDNYTTLELDKAGSKLYSILPNFEDD